MVSDAIQPEQLDPELNDGVAPEPEADESTQTILLVDDDARLRNLLRTVLLPLNCTIITAGSGEDALTELLQHKVAVIILDINLPGLNGFETAQLIRGTEELASTPIIFLTGDAAAGNELQRGYDLGAVDFLIKPVSRHVLYAKVKALLELDRSFARLRSEAARLHQQQLFAARAAEVRQRQELAFTRRRERLTNIFAEASIDLPSLQKTVVTELSQLFDADCVLQLSSPGHDWHDSLSHAEYQGAHYQAAPDQAAPYQGAPDQLEAWLAAYMADSHPPTPHPPTTGPPPNPYPAVLVEELTARGERVGVLCVGRPTGPAFSESDEALFRGAAAAAALAVSNATLYRIQAEYATVIQATSDAILAVDASGEIRNCNNAATSLFGDDGDTPLGRSIIEFAIDTDRETFRKRLEFTLAEQRETSLEMTCETTAGRRIDVIVTLSPIGDSADLHAAVVMHDVTEIRQAQEEIRHLASHDPLTGLSNRRQLTDRLADIVRQHGTLRDTVAVLFLDVNKFKHVNDTYGHDVGDELLLAVATRLRAAVSPETLVCRAGGDEFVVVLEHLPGADRAVAEADRILKAIQAEPVRCRDATVHPSISMGGSYLGAEARTPEELLSQADLAMYEAKKQRMETCVFYTDLIGSRHKEQTHLRAEITDAITRSELRMVYQPIVNAATGELFGLEALVRWRIKDEEVPASQIISLAEAANQTNTLGRWVLDRSFADFRKLGGHGLRLHLNISPDQVLGPEFLDGLITASKAAHVLPAQVCLELTECAFTGSAAPAYEALNRARDLGFGLAIDDFGVEYASMTNLMQLAVDCLKIDRSFIAQIHVNERAQRLVEGQIAVASAMRATLIAEGVETQEQADWLLQAGCDLQQGFLYAPPTETSDLATVLANTETMLRQPPVDAETEVP